MALIGTVVVLTGAITLRFGTNLVAESPATGAMVLAGVLGSR
jgi:hypothetical protein